MTFDDAMQITGIAYFILIRHGPGEIAVFLIGFVSDLMDKSMTGTQKSAIHLNSFSQVY